MAKGKRINIATLERGQHEDLQRGDAFTTAMLGELARGLFDDRRWAQQYPGYVQRTTSLETPLRAHVLSGLMVRVDNGGYLLVDPGALLAAIPAASADDSIVELVNDGGVTSNSALPFVANAAGSVRLDIVECQVNDTAIENVARGIFNPSTRVFDPTNVDKVFEPRLSYRIRQGVAGAGLPASASGWLPLCVVCHQPGTTSFANCDFWDVRPLVSDRVAQGNLALDPAGALSKFEAVVQGRWRSLGNAVRGYALGQFDGYVAGGQLIASAAFPITDHGNFIDSFAINYTPNRDPAFAMTGNTVIHIAALFPGGLPRWVKYVDTGANGVSGSRVPEGPRGILVLTNDQPKCNGYYAGVTLPAASGFTVDAPGICLATLLVNNAGTQAIGACVGRDTTFDVLNDLALIPGIAGVGSNQVSWTFSPNAGAVVPAHAKSIDVLFEITTTSGTYVEVYTKNQNADVGSLSHAYVGAAPDGANFVKFTLRKLVLGADLPWLADGGGTPAQTYMRLNTNAAASAATAKIVGFTT